MTNSEQVATSAERMDNHLEMANEALGALGAANGAFYDLVLSRVAATPEDSPEKRATKGRIQRQLLQGGIAGGDCTIKYDNRENFEGSFYIGLNGRTIRWRHAGADGKQHIYLDGDPNFAWGDKGKPVRMARIGGDYVVGVEVDGVSMERAEDRKSFIRARTDFDLAEQEREREGGRIRHRIERLWKKSPSPSLQSSEGPVKPAPVKVPHQQLIDIAKTMEEGLKRAFMTLSDYIQAEEASEERDA